MMDKKAMWKLADMNEQGTTPKARRMVQAMLELALAPTAGTRFCACTRTRRPSIIRSYRKQ